MPRAMFEYTKAVLKKVSFNPALFTKEVKKAVHYLLPHEIEELKPFIKRLVLQNPELNPSLAYL